MPDMSALGGKIKDNLLQNAGVTEKAIIEVLDLASLNAAPVGPCKVVGGNAASANNRMGNTLMNKDLLRDSQSPMKKVKKMMKGQEVEVSELDTETGDAYISDMGEKIQNSRRYFTVQFNPSTLQLSGHAGGLVQKLDYKEMNKAQDDGAKAPATYGPGPTTIIMSVSLLFDACDNQAAFLDDKLTLNASSVVRDVGKGIMDIQGKKKLTVQTEVEGFIAALRGRKTRLITFNWGEFCYSGVLRSVGVNYTMFTPGGLPIRAAVDLSIVCADSEQWPNSLAVWQQRYKDDFADGGKSFVQNKQMAGSLLSLPSF